MTDRNMEMDNQTNEPQAKENNNALVGRLDNTANPNFQAEEKEGDISHIDRQEGTMNNGELGSNLSSTSKENP